MLIKHLRYAIVWALFILILSSIPGSDLPEFDVLTLISFDKWVHAGVFFVLHVLLVRAFEAQHKHLVLARRSFLIAFVCCLLYGILLELFQDAFFVARTADILDVAANTFGSVMALFFKRAKN